MAHYDNDTKKFMDDVAEKEHHSPVSAGKLIARQGIRTIQDIATTPRTELPSRLVRRALAVATAVEQHHHHHNHPPQGQEYFDHIKKAPIEKRGGVDLYKYLNDKYSNAWHDWEPETLRHTLDRDGVDLDDEVMNSIQALQVICKTNAPFEEWHVFEKVGQALNNNPVSFGHVQPLEMDEIAYTIKILQDIRPKEEFEDDIKGYIAAAAKEAGMVYLPEDLYPKGCQDFLDKMGNDTKLRDAVAKVYPKTSNEETALGVQLARLSEVLDYVKE
jgi:hypothetical protein